jgi:outer membrane protein assembly factor BamA
LEELNKKTKALERERETLSKAIQNDDKLKKEAEELEERYGEDTEAMVQGMKQEYDQQEKDEEASVSESFGDDKPVDFGSISDTPN